MLMRREGDEWVATPGGWIRIKRGQGGRKGRQDWHNAPARWTIANPSPSSPSLPAPRRSLLHLAAVPALLPAAARKTAFLFVAGPAHYRSRLAGTGARLLGGAFSKLFVPHG